MSCQEFNRRTPSQELIALSWVQGFASGANLMEASATGEFMILPPIDDMKTFVVRFCAENRGLSLYRASTKMVAMLMTNAPRRRQAK